MDLLQASTQFPTVVFTIGLGIVLVYWVFVLLGALDIDLLGGGDVSGVAKGLGDLHVGADIDVDVDIDADGAGGHGWLGLGVVPLTISISLILLVCWVGSLLVMNYVGGRLVAGLVLVGMIIISLPIVSLLVRPLAPVFRVKEGASNRDYIGHTCTITTGRVDDKFGQANVEDGGTVHVISVRCDRGGLERGAKALIIDFDEAREAYLVEPSADVLPESKQSV